MDQLNTIQKSLENIKATNDINMDLYNDAHYYPDKTIEEPPDNLIKVKKDKDNMNSGVVRLQKGKIIRTKQDSNSELGNIVGNQNNFKLIESYSNLLGINNINYYFLFLLLLLFIIIIIK